MRIRDLITPVPVVGEHEPIRQPVALAKGARLDALPVVDDAGRLVGLLTRSKIFDVVVAGFDPDRPVSTIMVRNPVTAHADDDFADVQQAIPSSPVGQAVVVDDSGEPLGLFTKGVAVNTLLREAERLASHLGTVERVVRELADVRQLNRILDTVLDIAYDGITVVDEQGRVTLVNRSMCEFLGRPARDLIGRHVTEIMANTRLHVVAQTGEAEPSEVQVIRGTRHVVSHLPIIKDGRPSGAVGKVTFHGLRELREMVQKLEAAERNLDRHREEAGRPHRARYTFDHIVSVSPEVKAATALARRAALGDAPVLILGPSGTGKELFAHAIHNASPRRGAPFIKVNCAAVPADLLEAEFFGYEPGAFTGARSQGKPGKFELANGGTLFLDEVGDMSLALQAKLLRVLQDGEFERVGGTRPVRVAVRAIAATNRDLEAMVQAGQFRLDLLYRLNVISVEIPPLARRQDDIPPLVQAFVAKFNRELGSRVRGLTPAALQALQAYAWPGNVRELENVIRRAMYLAVGDEIGLADLPAHFSLAAVADGADAGVEGATAAGPAANGWPAPPGGRRTPYRSLLHLRERELVSQALERAGGNRKRAAELLGIGRATLYEKLRRLGLPTRKG